MESGETKGVCPVFGRTTRQERGMEPRYHFGSRCRYESRSPRSNFTDRPTIGTHRELPRQAIGTGYSSNAIECSQFDDLGRESPATDDSPRVRRAGGRRETLSDLFRLFSPLYLPSK